MGRAGPRGFDRGAPCPVLEVDPAGYRWGEAEDWVGGSCDRLCGAAAAASRSGDGRVI